MNRIMRPMRWWDMVTPHEEEMPDFLRAYMGKGKQFRTPKRIWQDLWMRKRGEMNHILGMRKSGTITNFKGPKYQKGMIIVAAHFGATAVGGGTEPDLLDIANAATAVSPTPARQQYAYDSDGSMECDVQAGVESTIVYAAMTTQPSGDSNDHTNKWWPDQPETNEGLNWEIRYINLVDVGGRTMTATHMLADNLGANRAENSWVNLDTVSNDHLDASHDGGIGCNHNNGTNKNPSTGTATIQCDVEIGADGASSAVTTHFYDMDCIGTSDIRLKKNIIFIGEIDNIRIYTWEWNATAIALGITDSTIGVLAQEVRRTHPNAVFTGEHGYLKVNYSKIFS